MSSSKFFSPFGLLKMMQCTVQQKHFFTFQKKFPKGANLNLRAKNTLVHVI